MTLEHEIAALQWQESHARLLAFERSILNGPAPRKPFVIDVFDQWTDLRRLEREARAAIRNLATN